MVEGAYIAAELCSAKCTLSDYAQSSRVALVVGVDLELAALLCGHGDKSGSLGLRGLGGPRAGW
jgi:hypothetical protein